MEDRQLLREYVERQSEPAFAELVARHLPRVLATAQRLMREPQATADVAQLVFIRLARKAWTIRDGQVLSGWLYRTTRYTALNALRVERRRQLRETNAMQDAETQTTFDPEGRDFALLLDEAMQQLKRPEQDVVLLRFFEGKSYGEIGRLLHLDEKTASQRVHRALEKMRRHFQRQGVTTTALLLGSALGAHGAIVPPAEMSAQVAGASLAGAGGKSSLLLLLKTLYMTTTTKVAIATAVFVAAATVSTILQQREIARLRGEIAHPNPAPGLGASVKKPAALSFADRLAKAKADLASLRNGHDVDKAAKIFAYAATLDLDVVKALLNEIGEKPSDPKLNQEFMSLESRWGELDPAAALAWAQTIRDSEWKNIAFSTILQGWANRDPAAALAAVVGVKGGDPGMASYLMTVINIFAQKNPQAALAAVRNLPPGQLSELYPVLFRAWAQQDPLAAAAAAASLPPSLSRVWAQRTIAGTWAEQGPAAAMTWAKTLPVGQAQNQAIDSVLSIMSKTDPASATDYAMHNLPAGVQRDILIDGIAYEWSQQDSSGLLAWADKNLTGKDYDTMATAALEEMSVSNPAAAAAALTQLADPSVVNHAIPSLATAWAKRDPQAALTWAQSLPLDNVSLRNSAIANVFNAWTNADPAAAGSYILQNLAGDPSFDTLANQVATTMADTDPPAALKWTQSLPPGTTQDAAFLAALTEFAKIDPQSAWQNTLLLSDSIMGKAQATVIKAWADVQPAQAAAALTSLPEGGNLDSATAAVAKSWLVQDPHAASQWIDTLSPGSARDAAVAQIISIVGKNDPASAFTWAVSLGNETTRNTQVVKLVMQWSDSNPVVAAGAAQTALNNLTDLTTAQQKSLQQIVDKMPSQ